MKNGDLMAVANPTSGETHPVRILATQPVPSVRVRGKLEMAALCRMEDGSALWIYSNQLKPRDWITQEGF